MTVHELTIDSSRPALTASPTWLSRRPWLTPAIWLVLLAALALVTRPPLPVDETRYLSVAWEMWRDGHVLVPHLNGLPYSDKPPLLFWTIQLGWSVFGVTEWWPRLVPSLFGVASLALVAALADRLGLGRSGARVAPRVLAGFLLWVVFSVALMFDLVLSFFVVLGVFGVVRSLARERAGWVLVALAVAGGILTKGPVILLHLAGPVLLAPWWSRRPDAEGGQERVGGRWYGAALIALGAGLALAGAWVIPAAMVGGDGYRQAILFDQTAGRVVHSFAHQRPWYWYFPLLPAILFPFFFWPPLWRGLARLRGTPVPPILRLAAAWGLPPFLAFLAISGKQPHYLLPLLPPLALAIAYLLERAPAPRTRDFGGPLVPAGVIAVALLVARPLAGQAGVPSWVQQLAPGAGWLLLAALAVAGYSLARRPRTAGADLGIVSVVLVAGLLVAFSPVATAAYDVRSVAAYLGVLEREGRPIARLRKDEGEFNFLGRLERPLEVIPTGTQAAWLAAHPGGAVVEETLDRLPPAQLAGATLVWPYRTKQLVVWE